MSQFGCDSTTDEVLEGINLQGKQVIVTGATSGLGLETARSLAGKGDSEEIWCPAGVNLYGT